MDEIQIKNKFINTWIKGTQPLDVPSLFKKSVDDFVAELLEAKDKSEWISVEDKLPIIDDEYEYEEVLVIIDGICRTGIVFGKTSQKFQSTFDTSDTPNYLQVTHWMPLPQAPKK